MKNIYLASGLMLTLSACAMKTKVLDTPAVSMTHSNIRADQKIQETGPVTGTFCPDSFNDKGSIGLIDESVKNAQTVNSVDWIMNASFWKQGNCIVVEGTGGKILSEAAQPAGTQPNTLRPVRRTH